MTYKIKAYAKVNLHLEVLNKRIDSYHNIFCLNASLDLFDRIIFKELNIFNNKSKDILVDIHPEGGEYANVISSIPTEENLISKAVKSYLSRIRKSGEILVSVEKNIPCGAGLGGGSSDAAAALRLLNEYFKKSNEELSFSELLELGTKLGADVPYCLTGNFAFCEGSGEIIESIEGHLNYWVLTANNGIMINTAKAYCSLNRSIEAVITKTEIENKKAIIRKGIKEGNVDIFKHILKNDFEKIVFSDHPELKTIKNIMNKYDAEYTAMTGSGSSIIGLFKDKAKAIKAKGGLKNLAKVSVTKFH